MPKPDKPKRIATKALSFFRDCALKKWPLRGSKSAVYLVTQRPLRTYDRIKNQPRHMKALG
jgi:hypothetical protein